MWISVADAIKILLKRPLDDVELEWAAVLQRAVQPDLEELLPECSLWTEDHNRAHVVVRHPFEQSLLVCDEVAVDGGTQVSSEAVSH